MQERGAMGRSAREITDAELSLLNELWQRPSATVQELTETLYGNTAAAPVLAAFAAALEYFVRAPAVRHAAWLLVTLKLLTPPIVSLPLPVLPASWAPHAEISDFGLQIADFKGNLQSAIRNPQSADAP